jgi:hypothetical protein
VKKGYLVEEALLHHLQALQELPADILIATRIVVAVDSFAKRESVVFYEKLGFLRLQTVAGELGDRPVPAAMFLELGQLGKRR